MDKQSLAINLIFMKWTHRQQMPQSCMEKLGYITFASHSHRLTLSSGSRYWSPHRRDISDAHKPQWQRNEVKALTLKCWNVSHSVSKAMKLFKRLSARPKLTALLLKIEAITFEIWFSNILSLFPEVSRVLVQHFTQRFKVFICSINLMLLIIALWEWSSW